MEAYSLAETCTELLVSLFSGMLRGAGERTANELYSVVSRRLDAIQAHDTLAAFEHRPESPDQRAAFVATLGRQLARNTEFRSSIHEIIERVSTNSPAQHIGTNTVTANSGSMAAGGDINQTHTDIRNRKSYGGVVVGVVAVAVVLIVVVFAGRAVVNIVTDAGTSGLNDTSTCRDYLASSDTRAKAAVMKDLYLKRNKPELASDPFIIQNTEYFCGKRPDTKLGDLATMRG